MDVTPALISVAITVGSLTPSGQSLPQRSEQPPIRTALAAAPAIEDEQTAPDLRRASLVPAPSSRPGALVPMYVTLATLQGFDIYATSSAVRQGATEVNPVMKPVAGSNVASIVVKAAATAGSIYFTERAWKQNRKGAVILMTAINVATAAVVAHNTQVARRH